MYLIIGASGFIGNHFYDYCEKRNIPVCGTYYHHADNPQWLPFDLCRDDLEELCGRYLKGQIPEAVIFCGANTSIDSCKKNEEASFQLNVTETKRILAQAKKLKSKCVFLSSEAVFDGEKGRYTEDDIPNPITSYGKQKLEVEQYMRQEIENGLIFRISRAVGSSYGEKDIFQDFYNRILNQEEIVCLKDQSFCLTEVDDISQIMARALKQDLKGLYHIASDNYISRYHLADLYAQHVFGGYLKIIEKEFEEMMFVDHRHIKGGLDGSRLADLLDFHYMELPQILERYQESYEKAVSGRRELWRT